MSTEILIKISEISFVEMKLTGEYKLLGINDKYFWYTDENDELQTESIEKAVTFTTEDSSSKIEEFTSYYENQYDHKLVEFLLSENYVEGEVVSYKIYIGQGTNEAETTSEE